MRNAKLATLLLWAAVALAGSPERKVESNVLTSTTAPPMRIAVEPELRFVGSFPFKIRDVAAGERFLFAALDGARIRRMLIVQFEGFLPHVRDEYRFRITNPVKLGKHPYRHNTFFFDHQEAVNEAAESEAAYTARFLAARGLKLDRELMMSRFARPVGTDRRNEIIIFYFENLADHGVKLADFNEDADPTPLRTKLGDELTVRSLRAFSVTD